MQNGPLYEIKANLFKGLSHPLRIRVLEVLSDRGEVSVGEILDELGLEPSHLSQHLAVLRRHHLVESERRGSAVFYRNAYPDVADLLSVARALLERILQTSQEHLSLQAELPELSTARGSQ